MPPDPDSDGDGSPESLDCNDQDDTVYPGAIETCNGKDDNCDDVTDEGVKTTFFLDEDDDGFGIASSTTTSCSAPSGYVATNTDCNDTNPTVNPDAAETCNGIDDNCDTIVDGMLGQNICANAMIELAYFKAFTFTMGSPTDEVGRGSDETQHTVTLSHNFYMGVTEVTQWQFVALMGYNPSQNVDECGSGCPVQYLSWYEAAAFANALTAATGLTPCYDCEGERGNTYCSQISKLYTCTGYRLPTEAEWEYAARAGSKHAFQDGGDIVAGMEKSCTSPTLLTNGNELESIAWYCGDSGGTTQLVGKKAPNNGGLYDMSGNVWEWINDAYATYPSSPVTDPVVPYSGGNTIRRGGGYLDWPKSLRLADRQSQVGGAEAFDIGFRVVRSIPE